MHPDYDYDGAAAGIGCARQRHACLQSRSFGHSAMAGRVPHITVAGAFRERRQLVLRQSWHHFVSQERTLSQYIDLLLTSRLRRASASWKKTLRPFVSAELRARKLHKEPLRPSVFHYSGLGQEQLNSQCCRTIGWGVQRSLAAAIRQFIIPLKSGLPAGILSSRS